MNKKGQTGVSMNVIIIAAIALLVLVILSYVFIGGKESDVVEEDVDCEGECPIIGGDQDEHGCYLTAGYVWCESKNKCLRDWEEPCNGAIASDTTEVTINVTE